MCVTIDVPEYQTKLFKKRRKTKRYLNFRDDFFLFVYELYSKRIIVTLHNWAYEFHLKLHF